MPSFTAQTLIDRAAAIADMHDGFVTPTQWITWLNTESRALELFVIRSGYIQPLAATVDAASFAITVPSPLVILGVYEVSGNRYRPLYHQTQLDFTRQPYATPADSGDARAYTIVSNSGSDDLTVQFYPKPTTGTYRALYIPNSTVTAAVTDSVRWPLGFEERIVLGMARRALMKEESSTSQVDSLIAEQDRTIEEFCWSRNLSGMP